MTPFRLGDTWRYKGSTVTAKVTRVLHSRERRDFEAWGNASERVDFLRFPFDADDAAGRGNHTLIDVETWEKADRQAGGGGE